MLFAIAAVVMMVLMVFQSLPLVEAGKGGRSVVTSAVSWDSTTNRLQLNWTGEEALINQTRTSYVDSTSPADFRTAQSVTVWDVEYPTETKTPPDGTPGNYNIVNLDVMSTISARRQLGYSVSTTTSGGMSILNMMWDQLSSTHQLNLGVNGGKWMQFNQARICYGAFYSDAYVSTNGWVAFRNFTEANKNNPSLWMWGADTNVWNVTLPTTSGTAPAPPLKNAAVIAPLWAKIDYWDPSGGIRAGELSTAANTGFCVVWKYVHIEGTSGWSSFAVRIGVNDWSTEGVYYQNTFRFTYGELASLSSAKYGAGMEDQIGWHYTTVSPVAQYCRYMDATPDSDLAVKQVRLAFENFVSTDGGANWVADTTDSWVAPPFVDSDPYPTCEAFQFNLALDNPITRFNWPTIWEIAAAMFWIGQLFFFPAPITLAAIAEWAVTLGGQVFDLDSIASIFHVYSTDSGVEDPDWIANLGESYGDINMYGRDYMSGSTNKVHFAWDASMFAHLDWYIKTSTMASLHKLKITTTAWYGDIDSGTSKMPYSYSTSNEVVIGSTGLSASSGKTSWLGRTIPDGHSVKYAPRNVPTSEIPGHSEEYVAYHVETTVGSDVGYNMMAYNGVGATSINDPWSRSDNTVMIEGWFRMSDSLGTAYQDLGRGVYVYVMAPDRNHDGFYEEGNFSIVGGARVLFKTDAIDTWHFRTVKVYLSSSYGVVNPHEPFKIAIGRPVSAGYTGKLVAEWAGVAMSHYEKETTQEGRFDHWALVPSVTTYNPADSISEWKLPYSKEYDIVTSVTLTAAPANGANGNPLSRVGHWTWGPADPGIGYYWVFGQSLTLQMAGSDKFFTAQFVPVDKYEVYVEPAATTDVSVSPAGSNLVRDGSSIKITANDANSRSRLFNYWVDETGALLKDDSGVDISRENPVTFTVTRDRYVEAVWWTAGCVAEGTMVTMANGSQLDVDKLEVGDQILGYDLSVGSFVTETVLWVSCAKTNIILNINEGALRVTPSDQPIYVRNSWYEGWIVDPSDIQLGWQILDLTTNSWVVVCSLELEQGATKVYDFQTDGPMTYLANGYLVLDKPHK